MQGPLYPPREPGQDEAQGARRLIGILLIGVGAIVALAILHVVYRLLSDGGEYPLIQQITAEPPVIRTPEGEVVLPENFLVLGAYGVVIVLLAIASGLARAFLQIGAQLLQVDVRSLLHALREEIGRFGSSPPSPPAGRG